MRYLDTLLPTHCEPGTVEFAKQKARECARFSGALFKPYRMADGAVFPLNTQPEPPDVSEEQREQNRRARRSLMGYFRGER